jgi:2-polyprenyl-3-methyl-5-hydroxy-6-metoxy-1,4-benzoquinol methylase
MTYDWGKTNSSVEGSSEFFGEIDQRFFSSSPLYRGERPFSQIIPFNQLRNKRVLEIGCGQGSHTQLLVEAGCDVTAIDLTERAVALTTQRLKLRGLRAQVIQMDAEEMDFDENEFDFAWSWGVIHHSSSTDRIVSRVARVLKPGGEFRFMVYNRRAFDTYLKLARGVISGKPLRGMSIDDILSYYTDGYIARFYNKIQMTRLIEDNGLEMREIRVLGQSSEILPIPGSGAIGRLKYWLLPRLPDKLVERALRSVGSFLFGVAQKPKAGIDAV